MTGIIRLFCASVVALGVMTGLAVADRHCSEARESAFYAHENSADALKATDAECPAMMKEAAKRLSDSMAELDVCWCVPARDPLRKWYSARPADGVVKEESCRENARAINEISETVLREVEKCF